MWIRLEPDELKKFFEEFNAALDAVYGFQKMTLEEFEAFELPIGPGRVIDGKQFFEIPDEVFRQFQARGFFRVESIARSTPS
jgi:hypothetical protein